MINNINKISEELADNSKDSSSKVDKKYLTFRNGIPLAVCVILFAVIGVVYFTGIVGRLTSLVCLSCPECKNNTNTQPVPNDSANVYVSENKASQQTPTAYEPPLYPGYTLDWKLYISEVNNFLFLYPDGFVKESGDDALNLPIVLKNSNMDAEIIVQKLEGITDNEKYVAYEEFIKEISKGSKIEKYGYIVNFQDDTDQASSTEHYGYEEQNINNKKVYYSVYIRNEGWPDSVVVRTHNIGSNDLRAIQGSFKFIRN